MSRGIDGRGIFIDDFDRNKFLKILARIKKIHGLNLFAYCLMGNHFHLLFQVAESPLSSAMHQLLTTYCHYFNQRHSHQGHVLQSRYTAILCRRDSYLEDLLRYIHLNPVKAGLVRDAGDWHWSGHRNFVNMHPDGLIDLAALADQRGESLAELQYSYFKSIASRREILPTHDYENESIYAPIDVPSLSSIAETLENTWGPSVPQISAMGRKKKLTSHRIMFIERARISGHSLRAIAKYLNCSPSAVSQLIKGNRKLNLLPDPKI
jgi:REP element-mobilizing transposase RayT/DNA-binding CsgD family transcriptional regulator